MTTTARAIFAALALLIAACAARAQAPAAGAADTASASALRARNWAAACAGCHGPAGRAPAGSPVPALAGRGQSELVGLMQDFKQGRREATVMQQIARGYSDAQIEAIAGWFAGVR